jgi:hypothetical protein
MPPRWAVCARSRRRTTHRTVGGPDESSAEASSRPACDPRPPLRHGLRLRAVSLRRRHTNRGQEMHGVTLVHPGTRACRPPRCETPDLRTLCGRRARSSPRNAVPLRWRPGCGRYALALKRKAWVGPGPVVSVCAQPPATPRSGTAVALRDLPGCMAPWSAAAAAAGYGRPASSLIYPYVSLFLAVLAVGRSTLLSAYDAAARINDFEVWTGLAVCFGVLLLTAMAACWPGSSTSHLTCRSRPAWSG